MARVCVFIDGANFYHSCKANMGGRTDINMGSFASFLVGPSRELVRTYYYGCALPPDHDEDSRKAQQRFFTALQRIPYTELRLGRMVKRDVECPSCHDTRSRYQEKGVDMRIGVDMLASASKQLYDVAVLVSGDGDLVEAVRAVKDLGKHVEVATFSKGRSDELAAAADVITELSLADMTPLLLPARAK
ncbi:MAG: NYN domain-containing protein [Acidimicrobiales bacterium]|jgi:uncharacterized LabA/DUF88 family protein